MQHPVTALLVLRSTSAQAVDSPDWSLGTWYKIAKPDHRFERNMSRVTASIRDDGGVSVDNPGYKAAKAAWEKATDKVHLVARPDRGYLWLLSRTPEPDEEVLSMLVSKAEHLNFPTDDLTDIDHTAAGQALDADG